MFSTDQIHDLLDHGTVVGDDGSRIGKVVQVYVDDQSGNPEWATVKTTMFGAESFVPLDQATAHGHELRVPCGRDKVKYAPRVDHADGYLGPAEEAELYRFYGFEYADAAPGASTRSGHGRARAVGHEPSGPATDDATNRSKQQPAEGDHP